MPEYSMEADCIDYYDLMDEECAVGEPKASGLFVAKARCDMCLKILLRRCAEENPKWFTAKKRQVSLTYRDKVFQWLRANAKLERCLVFKCQTTYDVYGDDGWDDPYETEYSQHYHKLCEAHLKERLAELGM